MKNKKRVLALMLAGVLTLGCFPTTVGAVNNAYDGTKPADAGMAEVTAADWIRSFPVLRIMVRPGAIPLPIT